MKRTTRPRSVLWAAAVSVTTLAWLVPGAAAAAGAASPGAASLHNAALLSSPSDTGASDISNLGSSGWTVQSSAVATQSGAQISTPGFNASTWLPVSNDDAGAPGTEVEALAQNGRCPGDTALQPVNQSTSSPNSVYFSNNLQLCYGTQSSIGADSIAVFNVPWWWRTDFTANLTAGQVATLIVNGVV